MHPVGFKLSEHKFSSFASMPHEQSVCRLKNGKTLSKKENGIAACVRLGIEPGWNRRTGNATRIAEELAI